MAVISTGSHPKQLWPGVKAWFGTKYREKPEVWRLVFTEMASNKSYEEIVEETGFGFANVKPEGDAISYDTDRQGYVSRFTNTTYALGAKVTQEAIEDNQYVSVAQSKAAKLARSMRHTKEFVHANVLNRAFNSSYLGGDGKELVATDHPTLSGSQSNELSPGADFSEGALEDMHTQIRGAKDSRGLRIGLSGRTLVVPPQLEFEARRVLDSDLQSGTANNDINAVKGMFPGGVVVWDYLTDEDAWFVLTDADDGLLHFQRRALSLAEDNDFDTSNACMKADERYTQGWADWRGVYGSTGS